MCALVCVYIKQRIKKHHMHFVQRTRRQESMFVRRGKRVDNRHDAPDENIF